MGTRATGRKLAMQALYQAEVSKKDITQILAEFLGTSNYQLSTREWAEVLAKSAWDFQTQADLIIKKYAIDWDISRINPIDRAILRIALFELKNTDTPKSVILNEAIEIARKYSTDESPKFINGILGNFVEKEMKVSTNPLQDV